MKMAYIYVDSDKDIVGVYESWEDALDDLIADNEERWICLDRDTIVEEIQDRLYRPNDNAWWDILWMGEDEEAYGYIVQRPLIKAKKRKKG